MSESTTDEITQPIDVADEHPPEDEAPETLDATLDTTQPEGDDAVDSPPESPPEVESRPRTLADVHADITTKGPQSVTGAEYAAYAQWQNTQRQAAQAQAAETERLTKLYPAAKQKFIDTLAADYGITEGTESYLALQKRVDDTFTPLEQESRQAHQTPLMRRYGRDLHEALGRTQEAAAYIQSLRPDDVVQAAIEVGKVLGGAAPQSAMATPDEVAKWHKGEAKLPASKLIKAEDAQKAVDAALDVERRANPDKYPPAPTGGNRPPPKAVTYAQLQRMKPDDIMALPADVFEKAINGG